MLILFSSEYLGRRVKMALETETRERFRERVEQILGHTSNLGSITRQLRREGYAADMITRALRGVGVSVDGEGRATMKPGPRQSKLR